MSVDCSAHGNPDPIVEWISASTGAVVRRVSKLLSLPQNGSLLFHPFHSEVYDQKLHSGVYRCVAYNKYGRIVSRNVHVRAGKANYRLFQILRAEIRAFDCLSCFQSIGFSHFQLLGARHVGILLNSELAKPVEKGVWLSL